jgi:hypothetical protein
MRRIPKNGNEGRREKKKGKGREGMYYLSYKSSHSLSEHLWID